jgi:peptidoglycan/LPS O-acetylase OafA/YrhL
VQSSFRYRNFGAFRLLLAALVVLQHFWANLAPEELTAALQPFEIGSIAVLVFFCLSGFVILEAADRIYQDMPGAFFANRLMRIVPHFVLAIAFAIVLCAFFYKFGGLRVSRDVTFIGGVAFAAKNIVMNLLGFLPWSNRWMNYSYIEITWAIRVEMLFYVVIAAALLVSHLGRRTRIKHLSLLAATSCIGIPFVLLFLLAMAGKAPAMFQLAPYFIFGCSLYAISRQGTPAAYAVMALSILGMAWEFLARPPYHPTVGFERAAHAQSAILALLLMAMVILSYAKTSKWIRADRFLGDLTYPLYVWHMNVMTLLLSITIGYSYTILYLGLAASLVVAWATHKAIDPLSVSLRDFIRGRSLNQLWLDSSTDPKKIRLDFMRRRLATRAQSPGFN